jgi:hypothetical protein
MVTTDQEPATATTGPQVRVVDAGTGQPPAAAGTNRPAPLAAGWRDIAVGAAFEVRAATAAVIDDLRRTAAQRRRDVAELAERGALERDRGRRRAAAAVHNAATALATSPLVNLVVDAQLTRVLHPVVLAVLDDVLLLLDEDPERIQSLVRGQRDGMADELISRLRSGATAGDTAVDRMTSQMFHRGPRPAPPSPAGEKP